MMLMKLIGPVSGPEDSQSGRSVTGNRIDTEAMLSCNG